MRWKDLNLTNTRFPANLLEKLEEELNLGTEGFHPSDLTLQASVNVKGLFWIIDFLTLDPTTVSCPQFLSLHPNCFDVDKFVDALDA